MNPSYEIRFYVPADRSALEELYRAVYGEVAWRRKTNFGWTLDKPLDEAGATVALRGDEIVAAQPFCDLPLHTPAGTRRATLFLDVATHPAHQRRGLFRRVVDTASAGAFDRGTSIIMTTPNRLASRGFQSMAGWVKLGSLDCLFHPLGIGDPVLGSGFLSLGARLSLAAAAMLRNRIPRTASRLQSETTINIEAPWSPGADGDDLWSRAADQAGILVTRDSAFLRWRFGRDYRLFLAHDAEAPAGYVAARVVTRAGLKVGTILDCITVGNGRSSGPLLGSAVGWLKQEGASAAIGYFLPHSAPWRQAREAGFLPLPRFCSPRDYPVYAKVQACEVHTTPLLNLSFWHLTLADSDLA
jgi:hypothetical protein